MTYVTQIYCGSSTCNARTSEVVTKDHGDNPEPSTWHCPACGAEAEVHWRRTLAEHEQQTLRFAIGRVNAALYTRDVGNLGVPANILMLDELPQAWLSVIPR